MRWLYHSLGIPLTSSLRVRGKASGKSRYPDATLIPNRLVNTESPARSASTWSSVTGSIRVLAEGIPARYVHPDDAGLSFDRCRPARQNSHRSHDSPASSGWKKRAGMTSRSEEHTSELQSLRQLACRLMLEKKKK